MASMAAEGLEIDAETMTGSEQVAEQERLRCRFYENEYPEVDDVVMVNVKSIAEMGAYVSLLEYDGTEGMILLSELSRRRIRSINKLIRVGKNECVCVLRVDEGKGYIDLSKRRVAAEDIAKCEKKYNDSKTVHSIMRHVAKTTGRNLMDLNTKITWPLYKKYGHACKAFRLAVSDPAAIFGDLDIDEEVLSKLTLNINRRLTPQAIKIRADIEVTCFEYSGIEAIIEALNAGLAHSTKQSKLKIKLIAPPLYVVLAQAMDKAAGIKQMTEAINAIQEVITKHGGNLNIKMAPKATSQREDTELNKLMETLEMQNQEVDGDDQDAQVE